MLLEFGRTAPQSFNNALDDQEFSTKMLNALIRLNDDQEDEEVQFRASESIALIVS